MFSWTRTVRPYHIVFRPSKFVRAQPNVNDDNVMSAIRGLVGLGTFYVLNLLLIVVPLSTIFAEILVAGSFLTYTVLLFSGFHVALWVAGYTPSITASISTIFFSVSAYMAIAWSLAYPTLITLSIDGARYIQLLTGVFPAARGIGHPEVTMSPVMHAIAVIATVYFAYSLYLSAVHNHGVSPTDAITTTGFTLLFPLVFLAPFALFAPQLDPLLATIDAVFRAIDFWYMPAYAEVSLICLLVVLTTKLLPRRYTP